MSGRRFSTILNIILSILLLIHQEWIIFIFTGYHMRRELIWLNHFAWMKLRRRCGIGTTLRVRDLMAFIWGLSKIFGNTIISDTQSTFVKDRQILDRILIENEVVDEACKLKKDLLLFKVDFEKAYDFVDWGYLDDVLGRMTFPTLWRKWMKECVGSATSSVLVNGSPTNEFPLHSWLRQGDPLSPFLFLIDAEGLNVIMIAATEANMFTGYIVLVLLILLSFLICNLQMIRLC